MTQVSAIITTRNRLALLKEAIRSVLEQTYKNIEILVIDDASNDDTDEYMKNIKSDKIHYIRINENQTKGGNYARNLGIQNSNGEYIAFLDDDDEWLPSKIEKQIKILEKNKEIGVIYSGMILNYIDYNLSINYLPKKENRYDCSKRIFYNQIGTTSNIIVRKKLLEEINGFDENLNIWQDYDLMVRLCQITKIDFIKECLVKYRIDLNDKDRITNRIYPKFNNIDYINKKYEKQINNLSQEEKQKRMIMIYRDYAVRYDAINDKKKKREYLYKVYRITHSLKDLIKYVLNINNTFKIIYILKSIKHGKL